MNQKHFSESEFKPRKWLLYVLIVVNIVIVIVLANKIITDRNNQENNGGSIFDDFFDNINDVVDNDFDKRSFNSTFELYVGTEWGTSVSNLIDKVITNNKTNDKHIITVVFEEINSTDSDVIRSIKKSLDTWTEYEVILDYDTNGYVYLITIEK